MFNFENVTDILKEVTTKQCVVFHLNAMNSGGLASSRTKTIVTNKEITAQSNEHQTCKVENVRAKREYVVMTETCQSAKDMPYARPPQKKGQVVYTQEIFLPYESIVYISVKEDK